MVIPLTFLTHSLRISLIHLNIIDIKHCVLLSANWSLEWFLDFEFWFNILKILQLIPFLGILLIHHLYFPRYHFFHFSYMASDAAFSSPIASFSVYSPLLPIPVISVYFLPALCDDRWRMWSIDYFQQKTYFISASASYIRLIYELSDPEDYRFGVAKRRIYAINIQIEGMKESVDFCSSFSTFTSLCKFIDIYILEAVSTLSWASMASWFLNINSPSSPGCR